LCSPCPPPPARPSAAPSPLPVPPPPPPPPPPRRPPRSRGHIHGCTSLSKLLFIGPVGEMNSRDSYRTRPDMHDGFESLSLQPNGLSPPLPEPPPSPKSLTVDRRVSVDDAFRRFESRNGCVIAAETIMHAVMHERFNSFFFPFFSLSLGFSFLSLPSLPTLSYPCDKRQFQLASRTIDQSLLTVASRRSISRNGRG